MQSQFTVVGDWRGAIIRCREGNIESRCDVVFGADESSDCDQSYARYFSINPRRTRRVQRIQIARIRLRVSSPVPARGGVEYANAALMMSGVGESTADDLSSRQLRCEPTTNRKPCYFARCTERHPRKRHLGLPRNWTSLLRSRRTVPERRWVRKQQHSREGT